MSFIKPTIITGGSHNDNRGTISFVNDFDFKGVDRFYSIHHPDTKIIRAWQGHTQDSKYYYPIKGSWVVAWVKMEFHKPQEEWKVEYIRLNANESKIVFLPPGYANGFKALEKDSIIIGFNASGEEEEKEILRWDADRWLDWESLS
jgi:dTDP-4-dehydrorhamnose 3,5-epimerase-like enzyme